MRDRELWARGIDAIQADDLYRDRHFDCEVEILGVEKRRRRYKRKRY